MIIGIIFLVLAVLFIFSFLQRDYGYSINLIDVTGRSRVVAFNKSGQEVQKLINFWCTYKAQNPNGFVIIPGTNETLFMSSFVSLSMVSVTKNAWGTVHYYKV